VRASVGLHAAAALAPLITPEAWPWSLAAVALNHAGLTGAGLWPRSAVLGPNITRLGAAAAARGEIALTIDDGPDPVTTPLVLDLLARRGVQATFFVIGERARAHPALVRAMVDAGHDVQNHSLAHRHHFSVYGPAALRRDIAGAQDLLAELTGQRPHCFRAPAGLRSPLLDPVLHQLGLHLVSWTRRGFDTRDADPARVLQRLTHGLAGADILLLHDGNCRRGTAGHAVIVDVLPGLIDRWQGAGLRAVTLRAALAPRHAGGPSPAASLARPAQP
jgi:peptidoglycan/xylan/chitin deacetylase (PgdA/CDA1 family)